MAAQTLLKKRREAREHTTLGQKHPRLPASFSLRRRLPPTRPGLRKNISPQRRGRKCGGKHVLLPAEMRAERLLPSAHIAFLRGAKRPACRWQERHAGCGRLSGHTEAGGGSGNEPPRRLRLRKREPFFGTSKDDSKTQKVRKHKRFPDFLCSKNQFRQLFFYSERFKTNGACGKLKVFGCLILIIFSARKEWFPRRPSPRLFTLHPSARAFSAPRCFRRSVRRA